MCRQSREAVVLLKPANEANATSRRFHEHCLGLLCFKNVLMLVLVSVKGYAYGGGAHLCLGRSQEKARNP